MVQSFKNKSKLTNAIVMLAGLITYIGKDELAKILPAEYAYLAPIIVLIAGYIAIQTTENIRVDHAEQLAIANYEAENNATIDPAAEYDNIHETNNTVAGDE